MRFIVPVRGGTLTRTDEEEDEAASEFWHRNETPQHKQVIAHPFWLDLTPTTNAAYDHFVQDDGYQNATLTRRFGRR